MEFVLSDHAQKRIQKRKIKREWIKAALEEPDVVENDADDAELCHAVKAVPEKGLQKLRVVYNETTDPWVVVTAFFE